MHNPPKPNEGPRTLTVSKKSERVFAPADRPELQAFPSKKELQVQEARAEVQYLQRFAAIGTFSVHSGQTFVTG
jgi:hypothetical protein